MGKYRKVKTIEFDGKEYVDIDQFDSIIDEIESRVCTIIGYFDDGPRFIGNAYEEALELNRDLY